jgi:hypothetical protein
MNSPTVSTKKEAPAKKRESKAAEKRVGRSLKFEIIPEEEPLDVQKLSNNRITIPMSAASDQKP